MLAESPYCWDYYGVVITTALGYHELSLGVRGYHCKSFHSRLKADAPSNNSPNLLRYSPSLVSLSLKISRTDQLNLQNRSTNVCFFNNAKSLSSCPIVRYSNNCQWIPWFMPECVTAAVIVPLVARKSEIMSRPALMMLIINTAAQNQLRPTKNWAPGIVARIQDINVL